MGVKFTEEGDELTEELMESTKFFFRDSRPSEEARQEMREAFERRMKKREVLLQRKWSRRNLSSVSQPPSSSPSSPFTFPLESSRLL